MMPPRGTPQPLRRSPEMDADARWHLDKRVPISLLFAILAQTAGAFWWGATTNARIDNLEKQAIVTAPQADRLTRVEVKLDGVQEAIGRVERIITTQKK